MSKDWLDELLFTAPETTASPVAVEDAPHAKPAEKPKIQGFPRQAHNWGSGRSAADPFLSDAVSIAETPVSKTDDLTPEEDGELRKHQETIHGKTETPIPPMPAKPPRILRVEKKETATEDSEPPTLKERIRASVDKAKSTAATVKGSVAQTMKPVTDVMPGRETNDEVDEERSRKWNILWSTAAAWVISPGTLIAVYDRILLIFGDLLSFAPGAAALAAGGEPHTWDLMQGLAVWVKEMMSAAWEADLMMRVWIAAALGVAPQLVMGLKMRWAVWVGWLGAVVFIAFFWFPQWWEVYMASLAAASYYGWVMANRIRYAFLAFLLRIPPVAAVTGTIAYSPGAIF